MPFRGYFAYVCRCHGYGDDVYPVKGRKTATNGKKASVFVYKAADLYKTAGFRRNRFIAFHGCVDKVFRRPFFTETTVEKKKEVRNTIIRFNEGHFIFPVEEGDFPGLFIPRNIAQRRPAVPEISAVQFGQGFAGVVINGNRLFGR